RVTTWYSLAAGGDRSSHWGRFRRLGDTNATRSAASGWSPHMSDENSLPDHLLPCVPAKLRPQRPPRNGYFRAPVQNVGRGVFPGLRGVTVAGTRRPPLRTAQCQGTGTGSGAGDEGWGAG